MKIFGISTSCLFGSHTFSPWEYTFQTLGVVPQSNPLFICVDYLANFKRTCTCCGKIENQVTRFSHEDDEDE